MVIESISNENIAYSTDAGKKNAKQVENVQTQAKSVEPKVEQTQTSAATAVDNEAKEGQQESGAQQQNGQQMSQKFVSGAIDKANMHLPNKTKCEFYYDDVTNRVSITIKDKETDEVIKEIPPKETLEMVAKMWELAGILVDEKR